MWQKMQVLHLLQWSDGPDCFSPHNLWETHLLLHFGACSAISESWLQPGSQVHQWVIRQQYGHLAFVGGQELPTCCRETGGQHSCQEFSSSRYHTCSVQPLPASPAPASRGIWCVPVPACRSAGKACSADLQLWSYRQRCQVRRDIESRNAAGVSTEVQQL